MAREHEDLYLIILKYYRGAASANQKGNPDYHTSYTNTKLKFATALYVRTQEKCYLKHTRPPWRSFNCIRIILRKRGDTNIFSTFSDHKYRVYITGI
jgi:hypothetical protein